MNENYSFYQTISYLVYNLTLSQKQILDSSKLKEFADDNFRMKKIAENSQNG